MLLKSEILNTVKKRTDEAKYIPNYSSYVVLPNEGLIYSLKSNKFIGAKEPNGYWKCTLISDDGEKWSTHIHRVVCTACYGPIPEGMQVNHISEDKNMNFIFNLNLLTPKENSNFGTRNERMAKTLKGKTFSEERKNNISKAKKGIIPKANPPKQVAAHKDGVLMMIFPSTMEAQRNGFNQSHISACCRGLRQSHKGYNWRYL